MQKKATYLNKEITEINERAIDKLEYSEKEILNFDKRIRSVEKDLNTRMDSMSETLLKLMGPSENDQNEKKEG